MASVTIHKHENGYQVEARDPAAAKHNSGKSVPYVSEHKSFVFKHSHEVHKWLKANMDTALKDPDAEYKSAFAEASKKVETAKAKEK